MTISLILQIFLTESALHFKRLNIDRLNVVGLLRGIILHIHVKR